MADAWYCVSSLGSNRERGGGRRARTRSETRTTEENKIRYLARGQAIRTSPARKGSEITGAGKTAERFLRQPPPPRPSSPPVARLLPRTTSKAATRTPKASWRASRSSHSWSRGSGPSQTPGGRGRAGSPRTCSPPRGKPGWLRQGGWGTRGQAARGESAPLGLDRTRRLVVHPRRDPRLFGGEGRGSSSRLEACDTPSRSRSTLRTSERHRAPSVCSPTAAPVAVRAPACIPACIPAADTSASSPREAEPCQLATRHRGEVPGALARGGFPRATATAQRWGETRRSQTDRQTQIPAAHRPARGLTCSRRSQADPPHRQLNDVMTHARGFLQAATGSSLREGHADGEGAGQAPRESSPNPALLCSALQPQSSCPRAKWGRSWSAALMVHPRSSQLPPVRSQTRGT